MFKTLLSTAPAAMTTDTLEKPRFGLSALLTAYCERRFRHDIAAIMSGFDRLSDRHLQMIGLNREDLFDAVADMMRRVEEERAIGREVMAMLDSSPMIGQDRAQTHGCRETIAVSAAA
jgi:hypothetical protein